MRIQQIQIDNFKSFAGQTVVPFKSGFTTVSGPNGSGKSNIVDSILFCLGLSSSRTMRAEKLTDLINNTSHRREASVAITFNKSSVDLELDETGQPLSPVNPDDLITVSRRIKEGSSGYTSTYYLQGKPSTLGEVHEMLAQYNVSPGCYNVMMQGDVAHIVNMSALERRKIVDEIAGVADFDRKIEQAQKEMEATGTTIERNEILLGEIEARIGQLESERSKALEYQGFKDKRQALESQVEVARLKELQEALALSRQNLLQAKETRKEALSALKLFEGTLAETSQTLRELNVQVKQKGEDQFLAVQKQLESLKNHVARKEDAIAFVDERLGDNEQQCAKIKQDQIRLGEFLETLEAELATLTQQQLELNGFANKEKLTLTQLNQKLEHLNESGQEEMTRRIKLRQEMEALEDQLAATNRESLDKESDLQRLERDKERQNQSWSDSKTKTEALKSRYEMLSKTFETMDAEKETLERQLKEESSDRVRLQSALRRHNEEWNTLSSDYARLEARKKTYEEMSFGRSVELILNAGLPGVHGTLAQLGSVDASYSLAMEIALGGRVQQIVVDDERVGQAGIAFLKENRAGRATFLPLNKMRGLKGLPALPPSAGVVDWALNLISFDGQYQDIFSYALGDTLIVEDLEAARPLMNRYRMVTLDGSLMEKSGAMTGGSQPGKGKGSLFNASQLETELGALKHRITQAQTEKQRVEKHLNQLDLTLEKTQANYQELTQRHSRYLAELETLEQQLADMKQEQASSNTEYQSASSLDLQEKALQKELLALQKKITLLNQQKEALQADISLLDKQLDNVELKELNEQLTETKFQLDYYQAELNNTEAEAHKKQTEKQIRLGALEEFEAQLEKRAKSTEDLQAQRVLHLQEFEQTKAQIEELEATTSALDEELKQLQTQRDSAQALLLEQEKAKHLKERQVGQAEEQILACQARCAELEPSTESLKQTILAAGLDLETLLQQPLPPEAELKATIEKINRKMQALEPVNMLAIAEYESVKERQTELSEKVSTLNTERETLLAKINSYEELKRLYFMKAFDSVNLHFKEIYAELSDGYGQLILTKPEDPLAGGLTIEASPRGKKTQRVEAMSGGEKSLTSLAFVFSLQRYQPAPFYALDEVDQNLDGLNVEKLSNMVRREATLAQFIVVSLRKPMIENSDRTVGVTQKRSGISKVTGIQMRDVFLEQVLADEVLSEKGA